MDRPDGTLDSLKVDDHIPAEEIVIDGYRIFPQGMIVLECPKLEDVQSQRFVFHTTTDCRCGEVFCCHVRREIHEQT